MKKSLILLLISILATLSLGAQNQSSAKRGRVIDAQSKQSIAAATISFQGKTQLTIQSNKEGLFFFDQLPNDTYTLTVTANSYIMEQRQVSVGNQQELLIQLQAINLVQQQSFSELFVDDLSDISGEDVQEQSPLLKASRDPFSNTAGYTFSPARYRVRGYDSPYQEVMLNGMTMNDMNTGYSVWSLWGGLNDAVRNQTSAIGVENFDFGFGNIGGATNIDTRASAFRSGSRLTGSFSNRTYGARLMYTYATGLKPDGWAFAFSGSRRTGDWGYVDGVFYDAWSYFLSIEKKLNAAHSFNLTAFAAPTQRGVASIATQEAYDLTGSNFYNPNIGKQNGRWRNARVRNNHEPVINFNHYWKIDKTSSLNSGIGFRFGRNAYSALNWFNAPDPRPDYYRYLPSYFTEMTDKPNQPMADLYTEMWKSGDMQEIDWNTLYFANQNNYQQVYNSDGKLLASGNRAEYIIEDRRTDQLQLNLNTVYTKHFDETYTLNAGANYRVNRTHYFNVIKDLLGGEFWYDIDKYADRDFATTSDMAQIDLNCPDRIVKQGERFGTDYYANNQAAQLWGQVTAETNKLDWGLGLSAGVNAMSRYGNQRRGLFPENSYGESDLLSFFTYGAKGSLTYKFDGYHFIQANAFHSQQAPNFRNIFISPRTRNSYVENPNTEKIFSADLSYITRLPWIKGRLTGFYTRINDQTRNMGFYDDDHRAFSNFVITGIDREHYGMEFGAEIKVSPTITANAVYSWAQFKYANNPDFVQTVDNSAELLESDQVYWKGLHTGGTPQTVGSIGITYYSPNYWSCGINANYFARNFLDVNPITHTDKGRMGLDPKYIRQEKFDDGFTVDAYISSSIRISRKHNQFLRLNLSVSNILNNKDIRNGGFEQLRIRYKSDKETMLRPFPAKYSYMYGTTVFLNTSFQF